MKKALLYSGLALGAAAVVISTPAYAKDLGGP